MVALPNIGGALCSTTKSLADTLIALNAVRLPKFEPVNGISCMVAEKDEGKRFTATFRDGVILRMRRQLRGL